MNESLESIYPKTIRGYQFESVIGSGTYGVVCKYKKDGVHYAFKFETQNSNSQMIQEKQRLRKLNAYNEEIADQSLKVRIPKMYGDGSQKSVTNPSISFNYLILDYFEYDILRGSKYLQKSELALKMIQQLQNLHRSGCIHRDIKLDNFMIQQNEVYLIDFGTSKDYRLVQPDGSTIHIPFKTSCQTQGTPYSTSINSHRCIEVARVDDLISLIYSLLWLWEENLPWKDALNDLTNSKLQINEQFALCYKLKLKLKIEHLKKKDSKILFQLLKHYLEPMQDLQFENIDIDYEFIKRTVAQIEEIKTENDFNALLTNIHAEGNFLTKESNDISTFNKNARDECNQTEIEELTQTTNNLTIDHFSNNISLKLSNYSQIRQVISRNSAPSLNNYVNQEQIISQKSSLVSSNSSVIYNPENIQAQTNLKSQVFQLSIQSQQGKDNNNKYQNSRKLEFSLIPIQRKQSQNHISQSIQLEQYQNFNIQCFNKQTKQNIENLPFQTNIYRGQNQIKLKIQTLRLNEIYKVIQIAKENLQIELKNDDLKKVKQQNEDSPCANNELRSKILEGSRNNAILAFEKINIKFDIINPKNEIQMIHKAIETDDDEILVKYEQKCLEIHNLKSKLYDQGEEIKKLQNQIQQDCYLMTKYSHQEQNCNISMREQSIKNQVKNLEQSNSAEESKNSFNDNSINSIPDFEDVSDEHSVGNLNSIDSKKLNSVVNQYKYQSLRNRVGLDKPKMNISNKNPQDQKNVSSQNLTQARPEKLALQMRSQLKKQLASKTEEKQHPIQKQTTAKTQSINSEIPKSQELKPNSVNKLKNTGTKQGNLTKPKFT
ncbi:ck1 family protein kinase [Stylonychia lemnae]|uniref:Casein kinase I n=1 Tax=Stylonychia lemnae TaxID=5949 RepID=A0A078A4V6_STYLE|nr:ck1 family protein kinase [Stylonychia lemnae]|eukprot:CDW76874.1 ck1 family protein kinase [Stylonychia lemnae]